jgi:hypothetical protein
VTSVVKKWDVRLEEKRRKKLKGKGPRIGAASQDIRHAQRP